MHHCDRTKVRSPLLSVFIATEEGSIEIWGNTYKPLVKQNLSLQGNQGLEVLSLKIRSLDIFGDGRRIILGTYKSEIFEMSTTDSKVTTSTKYLLSPPVLKGPFTLDSLEKYEMNGLVVYPPEEHDKFVTCSDDGYVRIWSIKDRTLSASLELILNTKGEQVPKSDDSKLRAITINKMGVAAIGCKSGLIRVRASNLDCGSQAFAANPYHRGHSRMY